ncbi:hypothetical protein DSO57_1012881 [Entomophthora muscae]|uniref:Uncharacterized protein n=1 Tax=Entomophthora muscae TaxID=34485 RepID=A0ACC2TT09_9FUNG|nr:hypothetical protein DSO57_1012881 [Entomophthora muscae]
MVTDKSMQDSQALEVTVKDSAKRAPEETDLVNETKTKLYRDGNGNAQPSSHVSNELKDHEAQSSGELAAVSFYDSVTGKAIESQSIGGIELFGMIKDDINQLTSQINSTSADTSYHIFQLSALINEDEKAVLIKLFEAAQEVFSKESQSSDGVAKSPMWFSCFAMTKLLFGQFMNLKEPVVEVQEFVTNVSDKFSTSNPSPLILLSLVHLNEIMFSLKSHYEDLYPSNLEDDSNKQASTTSLPSEVLESMKKVDTLINEFSASFTGTQLSEVDIGLSQRLFIEWIETMSAVLTFNKFLPDEKEFILSALSILNTSFERLATPLLLTSSSLNLGFVNTLLFRIFSALGGTFAQPIKSILLVADQISQQFLDANEGSFEHFSSFGHMLLALSKLVNDCAADTQEDCTERSAEFYAKGLECFETALEFKDDVHLESYLNDLKSETGDAGPKYFALLSNDAIEDEDEDAEFVPSEDEENDNEEIIVNPAEEDLSDGVEDEDVPLDQIPEVTMEPGQVLLEGTRSTKAGALVEDEDESVDPEFVPQVTDVEEELGQSDHEDESGLLENDAAVIDDSVKREPTDKIPVSILTHSEPLDEESEEVDPEFVPLHKEVEEDLVPSDDEPEVITMTGPLVLEEDSEDDESFVPSDEDSEDDDILEEEDEEADM